MTSAFGRARSEPRAFRYPFMNVASGTFRPLNGHRYTIPSMTEEWLVSLVIGGGGSSIKGSRYRDLLRARLGDDVMVSAGKMHLFLYAGSAKAADEAGQVARAVVEEHGQFAEVRVERWDRFAGEWRDPDEPAEHEDRPEPGRLETTAIAFIKGAGQALARGDLA